jgi:multidrug transporter EmrE-like cation transporter
MGIFLITLLGYYFYSYSLQWQSLVGLLLIAIGVAIVNIYKNPELG